MLDEDESYLADPESCVRYIEATGIDVRLLPQSELLMGYIKRSQISILTC